MKKNKLLLLIGILALTVGLLVACGDEQPESTVVSETPENVQEEQTEDSATEQNAVEKSTDHEVESDADQQTDPTKEDVSYKAQMMIANYIVSQQGFHHMAEEIEKGSLDAGFLRNVKAAKAAVESITWSPEVEEVKNAFLKDVIAMEKALIAEDVEAAKEPAVSAHGTQHDLDHTVGKVVKDMDGSDMKAQMMIANYIVSQQGFHHMAEEIEKGSLDAGFLRNVKAAKAAVESITWSPEVEEVKNVFLKDVIAMEKALIAEDVEAAKEPAVSAHGTQHDLDHMVGKLIKDISIEISTKNDVLNMSDWEFTNLELKKGKNTITIKNNGDMPHGIVIPKLGVMSDDIGSGEMIEFEIDASETGEFSFYCSVPQCGTSKQHSGMIGQLTVS